MCIRDRNTAIPHVEPPERCVPPSISPTNNAKSSGLTEPVTHESITSRRSSAESDSFSPPPMPVDYTMKATTFEPNACKINKNTTLYKIVPEPATSTFTDEQRNSAIGEKEKEPPPPPQQQMKACDTATRKRVASEKLYGWLNESMPRYHLNPESSSPVSYTHLTLPTKA